MKKRIISFILCCVMLVTLLPLYALGDVEPSGLAGGTCGDGVTWTLDYNGVLTVSGKGRIEDFSDDFTKKTPWSGREGEISKIVIQNGVTGIGNFAFSGCGEKLVAVTIPDSVKYIGTEAFSYCSALRYVDIGNGVESIGANAFEMCSSLSTLVFGKALNRIGEDAFDGCIMTKVNVYYAGTKTQRSKIAFNENAALRNSSTWHYNHVQKITKGKTVAVTCTENGYTEYSCQGAFTYIDDIVLAQGHKSVVIPGYPATYESEGLSDGEKCEVCGKILVKQKKLPILYDPINRINISDFDKPAEGKPLDRDFTVTTNDPKGGIVTEGENAPIIKWYVFDTGRNAWMPVEDEDFVCGSERGYLAQIFLSAQDRYRFEFYNSGVFGGDITVNGKREYCSSEKTENGIVIELIYRMFSAKDVAKSHRISSVRFDNLPTWCVKGDKVSDFTPSTLKDAGKTGAYEHLWYLVKLNKDSEIVGMYIPKAKEALALKVLSDVTADTLSGLRKAFGETFMSGYTYIYSDTVILNEGYAWESDSVTVNAYTSYGVNLGGDYYVEPISTAMDACSVILELVTVKTPEKPVISLTKTDGSVKISWSPVPGAEKYQVYRSTDNKTFERIYTTSKTSYTDTKTTSGTKYYYKVRCVNTESGKTYYSAYSAVKSTVPLKTPAVNTKVSGSSIKLSWAKVTGATKYDIYRSTDGIGFTKYKSVTGTSFTDTDIKKGKIHYYMIKAVKVSGSASYTSSASPIVTEKILAAPTVTLAKSDSGVKLTWKDIEDAAKYQVYRSTDNKSFTRIYTTSKLSYTDTKASEGTKYYYKVRAVEQSENSTYYSEYSAVKGYTLLGATALSAKQSGTSAQLSWTKVKGADSYKLYRSTDGKSYSLLATVKTTSYTDKSLAKGSTYYYKVKAATSTSAGAYSEPVSVKIMKTPSVTLTAQKNGEVTVSWKAISGAAKYQVYRSTDNKTYKRLYTTSKLSYTDKKATSGTKYYYKVRAVDANSGVSLYSSVKNVVPVAAPTIKYSNGKISWDAVKGAVKYEVYICENLVEGGNKLLKTTTSCNVKAKKACGYQVIAVYNVGGKTYKSALSNPIIT